MRTATLVVLVALAATLLAAPATAHTEVSFAPCGPSGFTVLPPHAHATNTFVVGPLQVTYCVAVGG